VSDYRRRIQQQIAASYKWWLHLSIDLGLAGAVLGFALWHVERPSAVELAALPAAFFVANLVEYLLHRHPMHRPLRPRLIYQRHGVVHHSYFTHESMGWDSPRDLRWILFPAYTVPVLVVVMIPVALGIGALITPNAGWLSLAVTSAYYLTYEFLHTAYHLPPSHSLARNRVISALRRAHRTHHDPRLMTHVNFNVTFPVCDILFGTYRAASSHDNETSTTRPVERATGARSS
jgi:sterol desaturase/sphingolipid hydroxylase (fatty acid hydroxylase superfamily)